LFTALIATFWTKCELKGESTLLTFRPFTDPAPTAISSSLLADGVSVPGGSVKPLFCPAPVLTSKTELLAVPENAATAKLRYPTWSVNVWPVPTVVGMLYQIAM
jgi:hypothetical protein